MGLLDFLKKRQTSGPDVADGEKPAPAAPDPALFVELAAILSDEDPAVEKKMKACVADPQQYARDHIDRQQARDMADLSVREQEGVRQICLLALADLLAAGGFLYEADRQEARQDILRGVEELMSKRRIFADLADVDFFGEEETAPILNFINKYLVAKGFTLGCLDLNSGSYLLFLAENQRMNRLTDLAASLSGRIYSYYE